MTYQELIDLLSSKLKERPDFKDKKIMFFADVEGDGSFYSLDKLGDIYIDDSNTVNIDITRSNNYK